MFDRMAEATARFTGSAAAFLGAVLIILAWALSGPLLHFSDGWQLTINTGTTIVTFLMTFLIQHSQMRGTMRDERLLERIADVEDAVDMHVSTTARAHTEILTSMHGMLSQLHRAAGLQDRGMDPADK